jgi:hypothetical protein
MILPISISAGVKTTGVKHTVCLLIFQTRFCIWENMRYYLPWSGLFHLTSWFLVPFIFLQTT